jgi:hypothetical protein
LRDVIGDDEGVVRSVHEDESEEEVLKESHEDVLDTAEDEDRVEEGEGSGLRQTEHARQTGDRWK